MKLRNWLTLKKLAELFGIILISSFSYLPNNIPLLSITGGFFYTFILPGYLINQKRDMEKRELSKLLHIIVLSILGHPECMITKGLSSKRFVLIGDNSSKTGYPLSLHIVAVRYIRTGMQWVISGL